MKNEPMSLQQWKDKELIDKKLQDRKINWKFKIDSSPQGRDNFWYDVNNNYLNPEELLEDPNQLEELMNALKIVKSFENALEENGLIEEY